MQFFNTDRCTVKRSAVFVGVFHYSLKSFLFLKKVEWSYFISVNRLDDSSLPNKLQIKSSLPIACFMLQD